MARKTYKLEDLLRLIDEDYAWRRKELHLIKSLIPSSETPKQRASLRYSVPLLYAHWEGFVKKASELYLEFVAKKFHKHNELKSQFIALSLLKKVSKLKIKDIREKVETINFLINEFDKPSNILTKNIIRTRSNLKYEIFREILFVIDIDEEIFSSNASLINDLVDARNHIAHGNYLRVEYHTYNSMHTDVMSLMETFKTEVENAAVNESYMIK